MDKKSISKLQRYRYILGNNNGVPVDYGGNIRKRAKKITKLLDEEEQLREQRAKAQGYAMSFKHKGSKKSSSSKKSSQEPRKKFCVYTYTHYAANLRYLWYKPFMYVYI